MKKIIKLSAIILVEKPWNEIVFCVPLWWIKSNFSIHFWLLWINEASANFFIKLGLIKVSSFRSTQKARAILWLYGLFIQIVVRKKFNMIPPQSNVINLQSASASLVVLCKIVPKRLKWCLFYRQKGEGTNSLKIKRIFMWLPFNVFVLCITCATGNHPLKSHNSS